MLPKFKIVLFMQSCTNFIIKVSSIYLTGPNLNNLNAYFTILQWVVGYFKKENKYSVIPFTWILNCGNVNLSKWPMYGIVDSMIMEATYPELDWPTFPVQIVSQIFSKYLPITN